MKSWRIEDSPENINIDEGFFRKLVSKNLPSLKLVRSYDLSLGEYQLALNVEGLSSVDPFKTAVMISEGKQSQTDSGLITYSWLPFDNPDTLQIKLPYGNEPPDSKTPYYKKITFGILRTNE